MIIERSSFDTIRDSVKLWTSKKFLDVIEEKYKESNKADFGNILSIFASVPYDNVGGTKDYILIIVPLVVSLKEKMCQWLMTLCCTSFSNCSPIEFEHLKILYNAQRDKQGIDEQSPFVFKSKVGWIEIGSVHLTVPP